jgi:regulator of replication initiation timing
MFDGITRLLNLTRLVKEQMADLELLVELLNIRIESLTEENDRLIKENKALRQFLSGQDE